MKKQFLPFMLAVLGFTAAVHLSAAVGGPDTYGYTWIDSDEPGGPVFSWIEIATPMGGPGTYRSTLNCDDCHEPNIPLGFDFPFYGTNFNQVSIGSNGVVYFENVYLGLSNACMPGTPSYTMAQYNFIAMMWDDLAPNYQGGIYTYAGPNYFVIEYYDIVPCCAAGDGDTWQVILFKNGNILMQYKELSNQGIQTDFTIGIQNDPATGLQYRCDASGIAPANGRAILFSPPSFSCASISHDFLHSTTSLCGPASVVLDPQVGAISSAWSTGETTPTITVSAAGTYYATLLDTNGCSLVDTTMVIPGTPPVVALGADVEQCGGNVLLDAGNPGAGYLWNDSSTAQTLSVSASGTFYVEVMDPAGCSGTDTIVVTIHSFPVAGLTLAKDSFCINEPSVALSGGTPAAGVYLGAGVTAGSFSPSAAGTGTHTITYIFTDGNNCADTATQDLVVLGCLSIEDATEAMVQVYPNPTKGIVNIRKVSNQPLTAEIMDMSGKVLVSRIINVEITQFDLSGFVNGVYMIRLTGEKESRSYRVVLDK